MGRMVNTRHDNVPRWLDRLVAVGTIIVLAVCALALYVVAASSPANADELPPGYVEPPGPCVLDPESGLWLAGVLPCGPTLLEIAGTADPASPVDAETGCTPAASSDGCAQPATVAVQSSDGCVGPDGYCTTEPTTTTVAPTPTTTVAPTTTTTVAPTTTTVAPTTTTTVAPTTSTSVAVGPPPTPPTTAPAEVCVITIDGVDYEYGDWVPGHVDGGDHGATSGALLTCTVPTTAPSTTTTTTVSRSLPVTGNTNALWLTIAGACSALLGLILVRAARR